MLFRKKSKFDLSEVLDGCRKNKPSAQRQLVEQYYVMAKKLCIRYAKNSEEADEMVDDGFLKILGGLHKFDPTRSFEPWLRQVMVNTAIDHYRKRQHLVVTSDLDTAFEVHHDAEGLDLLSAEELLSLIQQLPPTYRLIFNMYAIDGYDHNEIAEQLGIISSTSRANLAKARAKLQKWVLQISQSNPTTDDLHVLRKI